MKTEDRPQQIGIRPPAELRDWLARQAAANHRSLNGQVLWLLEQMRKQQEQHALQT